MIVKWVVIFGMLLITAMFFASATFILIYLLTFAPTWVLNIVLVCAAIFVVGHYVKEFSDAYDKGQES
jgi:hypothetical protein